MKDRKNNLAILLLLSCLVVLGWSNFILKKTKQLPQNKQGQNKIIISSSIPLKNSELSQLLASTDEFMSEYRLPKGIENTYNLSIERRLNDSLEININPNEAWDTENRWTIYARKTNNTWQVDPKSGPWCNLTTFENKECLLTDPKQ